MANQKIRGFVYPWNVEKAYLKWIVQYVQKTLDFAVSELQEIMEPEPQVNTEVVRMDAPSTSKILTFIENMNMWVASYFPEIGEGDNLAPARMMAGFDNLSNETRKTLTKQWANEPLLANVPIGTRPAAWWDELQTIWETQNYTLIRNTNQQLVASINTIVEEGVVNGYTTNQIAQSIYDQGDISANRARLIARDQIGKLTGKIQQAQQENAGFSMYTWENVGDERVRGNPGGKYPKSIPNHWEMSGVLCRWDNATVYSIDGGITWIPREQWMPKAHPGQEIQCRCLALPYASDTDFNGFFEGIEYVLP